MKKTIAKKNIEKALKDGPGLSYGYTSFVIANDLFKKRILLGGLGGMGVGIRWFHIDDDDQKKYESYPNYNDAIIIEEKDYSSKETYFKKINKISNHVWRDLYEIETASNDQIFYEDFLGGYDSEDNSIFLN